jgi:hypothetical protein
MEFKNSHMIDIMIVQDSILDKEYIVKSDF